MKKNMGMIDRVIRVIAALVIGALYINGTISGILAIVLIIVAVVFLATSSIGVCPLYIPFGIKTKTGDTQEE